MKRLPLILVGLLAVLILAYSSVFIVSEREQAIVLRFGEIRRVIQEPGIYFKVPTNIVEAVQIIDDRILNMEIQDIRVQVRDGRRYLVDAFVAFRIVDPREFRESASGSLPLVVENLGTRLDAALRRVYGRQSFEAALSAQRAEMMREVAEQLRPLAAELGIQIVDVRVRRTDLLPEVSQQTFERMRAERLAEAAELRALGTQERLRIQAEADREATVTVAEARRDSEILRGEGDAQRNRIFAEAFQRDPDFFEFYRSMQAYRRAIEGSDNTTLVLSPDSEFFRFFRDAGGTIGGDEAPASGPQSAAPQASGGEDMLVIQPSATDGAAAGGGAPAAQPAGEAGAPDAAAAGAPAEAAGAQEDAGGIDVGDAVVVPQGGAATGGTVTR